MSPTTPPDPPRLAGLYPAPSSHGHPAPGRRPPAGQDLFCSPQDLLLGGGRSQAVVA